VNVSPQNAGTIEIVSPGQTLEPVAYPEENITCFFFDVLQFTAKPRTGYQFAYWDFNIWPADFYNKNADKTSNPMYFYNTSNDYPVPTEDARIITAYFTRTASPPDAPKNVSATDGKETGKVVITWDMASGSERYEVYWTASLQGEKTALGQTTGTRFEDANVIGDTVYYYWVKAVNSYGASPYSDPDSGYAFVDINEPPPEPLFERTDISPEKAKQMLDDDPGVIVLDVSAPAEYEQHHILCAINREWNDMFVFLDYKIIAAYKDYPVLVYDQDGSLSALAADYLAGLKGFSNIYHMTGGLQQWIARGWETFDASHAFDCALPPIALAGQDTTVDENQSFTLDGSSSGTTDSGTLAYEWRQFSGTSATFVNADSGKASFISPYVQEGGEKLIFLLTVTDALGNKDTDSVAVDVTWQNSPPVADAGQFQSVAAGTVVVLDGSGSTDRDNGIVSYQWIQTSGPEAELTDSTSKTALFTAPEPDTDEAELAFTLTVTDKGGLSDEAQISVQVIRNNKPPVADAGPRQEVSETHTVQLDGSGSQDPDDGIASYSWTQIGTGPSVQLSSHSDVRPTFTAPLVQTGVIVLKFLLTVTDNSGVQSTSQVDIEVKDAGDPPRADAGTDQTLVYEGWQVSLNGTGSVDADGGIRSYRWIQVSGPTTSLSGAESASPKFTAPIIDDQNAQLVFELTVTDDVGLISTDQVKIIVNKAVAPPIANAGPDQEIRERKEVTLDGSASSDADDGIVSYSWRQVQGEPLVDMSDASSRNPVFLAPDVKTKTALVFELAVTDYSGKTDTDEVTITVLTKSSGGGSCFISTLDF
jgi:rhodanese-related sulfurtransferase